MTIISHLEIHVDAWCEQGLSTPSRALGIMVDTSYKLENCTYAPPHLIFSTGDLGKKCSSLSCRDENNLRPFQQMIHNGCFNILLLSPDDFVHLQHTQCAKKPKKML